jgi:hypothetical protein
MLTLGVSVLCLVFGMAWRAVPAAAQSCDWASGFEFPGVCGSVRALAVFDDGSGLALYTGGGFAMAGDRASFSIAAWHCP